MTIQLMERTRDDKPCQAGRATRPELQDEAPKTPRALTRELSDNELLACLNTYREILDPKIARNGGDVTARFNMLLTGPLSGRYSSVVVKDQMRKISAYYLRNDLPIADEFAPDAQSDEKELARLHVLASQAGQVAGKSGFARGFANPANALRRVARRA